MCNCFLFFFLFCNGQTCNSLIKHCEKVKDAEDSEVCDFRTQASNDHEVMTERSVLPAEPLMLDALLSPPVSRSLL